MTLFFLRIEKESVVFVRFGFDAESAFCKGVSKNVIQVQMRIQNAHDFEIFAFDVIREGNLLAGIAHAWVN